MHARELVELAGILATHGPTLVQQSGPIADAGLERYWSASKCRLDRWGHSLKRFTSLAGQAGRPWYQSHWPAVCSLLEEVLTGEVLTRVWTALVCAHDRTHNHQNAEPVARSVFVGHLEARNRVLTLLVHEPIEVEEAFRLDRLRRRTDRWSDVLLGCLAGQHDVSEFTAEPGRAQDFAADLAEQANQPSPRQARTLVQSSLREAFRQGLWPSSPNADLNAEIAAGILACFPRETFDAAAILRSLWATRMAETADDALALVEQLLGIKEWEAGNGEGSC